MLPGTVRPLDGLLRFIIMSPDSATFAAAAAPKDKCAGRTAFEPGLRSSRDAPAETPMSVTTLREIVAHNAPLALALGGFLIGLLFGWAVYRTNYCAMGSLSDIHNFG